MIDRAAPPSLTTTARLPEFVGGVARSLVAAQSALDDKARASLIRWEEDAIPPSAFVWRELSIRVPIRVGLAVGGGASVGIAVAPTHRISATLRFTFRHLDLDEISGESG